MKLAKRAGRRRKSIWRLALLITFLALAAFALYLVLFSPRLASDEVKLVRVSDGDTVVVRDQDGKQLTVRLIGVDAPELGTAASFRSALFAAELCEKARVIRVEPEPSRKADKYGRLLGWVWLTMPDGRRLLLNAEMIHSRHATLYESTSKSVKYYDRLR